MPLSRLDNFLKNVRGNILYVNPNDLDATDSVENQGNSLARPFKTIQRALIEAARFSYQSGLNNDRFGQTTILLYPGDHVVDNRPGLIPDGANNFRKRDGTTTDDLPPFDLTANFNLESDNNVLYKLNSIHGGVIIPRGTSIVGLDLRKTKIRPKYVPNPENDNIARTALFRVTGVCYFWQFTIFDGDPSGTVYTDYTTNTVIPNFSHHKLTCFEYADGVNSVNIADEFQTYSSARTDLDMYYEKVGRVYGPASGRGIQPDYPDTGLDIQPKIDEYRIVGPTAGNAGISTITASGTTVTIGLTDALTGLDTNTPIVVDGVTASGYDGKYVVSEVVNSLTFKYKVQNPPTDTSPPSGSATVSMSTDTVTSASPYIFNISLRSVFGMCGLHADGSAATGFKSMVVAQFTGIGLQKDDNAFLLYDSSDGEWDSAAQGLENLSTNSRSVFKPSYKNYHIKASNNAVIQNVSIFAIGYAEHFVAESGGDMSVTNSNSNFGARALVADGFRRDAFSQDDTAYISHVIPPQEVSNIEIPIEFNAIDVAATVAITTTSSQLYLNGETNADVPPENVFEGYRIGARTNDQLNLLVSQSGVTTEYSSRIVMQGSQSTREKSFEIGRVGTANSISGNIITLTENHDFLNGESIRIISDSGQIPDGLEPNVVYFAITDPDNLESNQIRVAATESDALTFDSSTNPTNLEFNALGGKLTVSSRVSDKRSGDIGHPIQYNSDAKRWYINVSTASTDNQIGIAVSDYAVAGLGSATSRTFVRRCNDNRSLADRLYRYRYVIPKGNAVTARPPSEGFIFQESNTATGISTDEVEKYFGTGSINDVNLLRNPSFISDAAWSSTAGVATVYTELPHNLDVGNEVQLYNIKSSENTSGASDTAYNRVLTVTGISSAKAFTVGITTDPGTFQNDTTTRNLSLPYFKRKKLNNVSTVYRQVEIQKYIKNEQDGVYYLTILNNSNSPTVSPFTEDNYSQPVQKLYPQLDRDNTTSDPAASKSFASSDLIGEVVIDDPKNSITREAHDGLINDIGTGVGVTDIVTGTAGTSVILKTNIDHGLNRIVTVSLVNGGSGYGNNSGAAEEHYNAALVGTAGSTTGEHATAKVFISAAGEITKVKIMDGGSAYGIGNTMHIVGIPTFSTFEEAVVQVEKIYDNTNDVIKVTGISSLTHVQGNQLYRIENVNVGASKTFDAAPVTAITGVTTTGIGTQGVGDNGASLNRAHLQLTGPSLSVSSFTYENTSGIATVVTNVNHGAMVDRKLRVVGTGQDIYNDEFVVTKVNSATELELDVGINTNAPSATGTIYLYPTGNSSQGGDISLDNENTGGRMVSQYAGITTTLSNVISDEVTPNVQINNPGNFDINIGDYLEIGSEIVRVKETTATGSIDGSAVANPIVCFRGVLGTKATTHAAGSVIRRIKPPAVELRRHSIIRASAHTFEYVGFGPGNYSTALPDRQDRQLSENEELLSQSTKRGGGINFYTGMNDRGISYSGNKKLSSVTGEEEVFDTPIQTVTGEDVGQVSGFNVLQGLEANVTRSLKVEGGATKDAISQFDGPVIFSQKVTSISPKGIEVNNIFLQGDATVSRNITVGIATPALAGNAGDIVFNANPTSGGYAGWVFTTNGEWQRFGGVSDATGEMSVLFDRVGVGTTTAGTNTLQIGAGSSMVAIDGDGVGIGTTANGFSLHVNGNANITGVLTATGGFVGDGSGLTNLSVAASGWSATDAADGYYNTGLGFIGIGTSVPGYTLEIGDPAGTGLDLVVNTMSKFTGLTTVSDINVTGILTAANANLTSANVSAGIVTATNLQVGTAITTSSNNVGIGTSVPRAKLDIEGEARLKAYSEHVEALTISSNVVTIDLSSANTFTLDLSADVNSFELSNIPDDSTEFTIKITQDSTGSRAVGIDTFANASTSAAIPVYWPGGGVLPIVTQTASKTDIYSFKTFDGGTTLYGFVGGQNFA